MGQIKSRTVDTGSVGERDGRMGIRLFGTTQVFGAGDGTEHQALGGVKPRQVLEILALSAGTPVAKDQLAEMLWDGNPPRSYPGTLESYVCLARRALGRSGRASGIATVMHGYVLDPERVDVDLVEFRTLVRATGEGEQARLERIEAAVALVEGTLLASEAYAPWAISERDHFKGELGSAATEGSACALRVGDTDAAVRLARLAVDQDAFDESARRALITALAAAGRRNEALRAYFEFKDLLAEDLGASPSPATTQCYLDALSSPESAPGAGGATRQELQLLLQLVREAARSIPGIDVPAVDRGLVQLAASLPVAV